MPSQRDPAGTEGLPLYREVKWDYRANRPVYVHGAPVVVTGAEAVMTWAYNALQAHRGTLEAFGPEYGNDVYTLTGKPYTGATKNAEAVRYIRECLTANPYVREITGATVSFAGTQITISFRLATIYGEVPMDVIL